MSFTHYLSMLIKKKWNLPVEQEFAGEVEEKVATNQKLPESEAKKFIMSLYKKYLPKLGKASDDFWDILDVLLSGVKASTGSEFKRRAKLIGQLSSAGILVHDGNRVKKSDIQKFVMAEGDEPSKKKFSHAFDVAFELETDKKASELTNEEILAAMSARVEYLRSHPQEIKEAIDCYDTIELE